jgi:nucleoside phosphorylase
MLTNALVAFAMKEEFAPWRRKRRFRSLSGLPHPVWAACFGPMQVCVTLVGAGAPDAPILDNLISHFQPSLAVVTGVAAGLKPQWRPGDIFVAESVTGHGTTEAIPSSPHLVEIARNCGAKTARTLITMPRIVRTIRDKIHLGSSGDAVDMESTTLMNYWSARRIPSVAVRVILDPVEMAMTCDFEMAMDAHGQVMISKIIAQLARRPQLLPDFLRLARQSRQAMLKLAQFLDRFFEQLGPAGS